LDEARSVGEIVGAVGNGEGVAIQFGNLMRRVESGIAQARHFERGPIQFQSGRAPAQQIQQR
jgi:hypothetical protein